MIKNNTVLILGAGASHPYGFPLGTTLMSQVINNLRGEGLFNDLLRDLGFNQNNQLIFARELHNSMQPSIDAFVQNRKDFLEIGKACIAISLIPYEKPENLMTRDFNLPESKQGTRWYEYLLNLLGTKEDFTNNHLSIITFNYDRSLEFFIYNSIMPRFNINNQEAIEFMKSIPIVHSYGQLGKPVFQNSKGREYSPKLNFIDVQKAIEGISLMYEDRDEATMTVDLKEAHLLISEAKLIVFLGFGYHKKNIERLRLSEYFKGEQIVATFHLKSPGEIQRDNETIKSYTPSIAPWPIPIHNINESVLNFLKNTNYLK